MIKKVSLVYPFDVESPNKILRMSWQEKMRIKHKVYSNVSILTIGKKPPAPFEKASIKIVRKAPKFYDWDNLVGAMKNLVDGLVLSKIILDDKYEITGAWDVTQEKIKGAKNSCVEITVKDLTR